MLGLYAIPKATPAQLMYAWDGLIVAFLFFWAIGLVTELQRTEPLSLSKFLHLPVSVNGAFLINYLSSLLRLSLIVFGPIMLGFCLALVWTKGISLLPVLPSLAAFLVMVTALTYQFQGWLASLMSNPRRRRTVVVATTMIFVLIVQLPNLMNFIAPWNASIAAVEPGQELWRDEMAKLDSRRSSAENSMRNEFTATHAGTHAEATSRRRAGATERRGTLERTARLANLVLPVGWLPLGVAAAAEGRVMPSILGLLGMTLIGTASLWRAYRTTVGLYQGQSTNRKRSARGRRLASPASARQSRASLLLEARLPGLSEPVSAIALGGLRSLVRSPEAKMMLLTPVIMIPIFGSMLWRGRHDIPEAHPAAVAIGGMVLVLFGVLQLMGNQFGFDRDGFRVFVLSPPRGATFCWARTWLRPAGAGAGRDPARDRAGRLSLAAGPLPGHVSAVDLDVSAVLHLHELAVDSHAGSRRRGLAQAVEPEYEDGPLATGDVSLSLSADAGADPPAAGHRGGDAVSWAGRRACRFA